MCAGAVAGGASEMHHRLRGGRFPRLSLRPHNSPLYINRCSDCSRCLIAQESTAGGVDDATAPRPLAWRRRKKRELAKIFLPIRKYVLLLQLEIIEARRVGLGFNALGFHRPDAYIPSVVLYPKLKIANFQESKRIGSCYALMRAYTIPHRRGAV